MDINSFSAAGAYGATQKLLRPDAQRKPDTGMGAESGFNPATAIKGLAATVAQSEQASAAYMTGKADPHSVVEALASAELAVETAVTLRNRVVEAYQELMRMPV